ncbi:leucyl aminopeptidase [Aquicoccus sp. G2-2]|uniref:leucyl aminopeptidase n=1 Tax=Aquicoccus sp. G2-2 TaxID=3092120 RepID=UPI002ADFBF36|nr:leucyl aminopeptidase [Aquicoccus sp. G2-2]MEA1112853.1 leucyl aminopeptidase [Aquicoccus sp. G2-2]
MSAPLRFAFAETDIEKIADAPGRVAVLLGADGKLDKAARRVNRLTRGALARVAQSESFAKAGAGDAITLAWPAGMAAEAVDIIKIARRAPLEEARKAGASLAKTLGKSGLLLLAGNNARLPEIVLGLALRSYKFEVHKTAEPDMFGPVDVMCSDPEAARTASAAPLAVAEGAHFTRDLVNEPANALTTTEFANRLAEMQSLGLKVEVLDEPALEKLGMGALLGVGQGSASPSKVVVMEWQGGAKGAAPLALIGKGVVFDTGGISIKPSAGMEEMTMDMGGAAVVSGTMRALALRKAKANVVGLVGIVENMPSGDAIRPGDVLKSMKGDTIEVISTDAEGRLVLADVMWYAQQRFKPAGMIDLATLTGAIIIGLGHENAGVFSNDDALCKAFLKAAEAEGEGAWRMPLGAGYDKLLKSRIADMKNLGGRPAGAVTAAQFLQRFVQDDMAWIHLDIAGVALVKGETAYAPEGATGWGVLALNRLISDSYEVS